MQRFAEGIANRKGQRLAVCIEIPEVQRGLAFVQHGLGGFKEQKHIRVFVEAFLHAGFAVVSFDTTNSIGESDGDMSQVTVKGSYEDLEAVIAWAAKQQWYREPFALAGHSLGGMCASLYAEQHPEKISALAPISTLVSGRLMFERPHFKKIQKAWEETKWYITESASKPGIMKKIPWSFNVGAKDFDIVPHADRLTMPILMIVGELDPSTPVSHQQILYDALPVGKKELHIIPGAAHTFRDPAHLQQVRIIFDSWLATL